MGGTDRLIIGRITAPFGIRGWLKVHSFTEPASNLLDYRQVYVGRKGQWRQMSIDSGREHGTGLAVHFEGCDDRNQAELMAKLDIAIDREALPPLAEGEYYWDQLVGLRVYSLRPDGSQLLLGEVDHLLATGANDVLVVEPCEGSIDGRQRLVPYVPGPYVLDIDLAAGRMQVDWDPEF